MVLLTYLLYRSRSCSDVEVNETNGCDRKNNASDLGTSDVDDEPRWADDCDDDDNDNDGYDDDDDPGSLDEFVVSDSSDEKSEEEKGDVSLIAEAEIKELEDERKKAKISRKDRKLLWSEDENEESDVAKDEAEVEKDSGEEKESKVYPKKASRRDRRTGFQDRSIDDDIRDVDVVTSERSNKRDTRKLMNWSSDSEDEENSFPKLKTSQKLKFLESTSKAKTVSTPLTQPSSSENSLQRKNLDSEEEGSFKLNSISNDLSLNRRDSVDASPVPFPSKTPKISKTSKTPKTNRAPIIISSESDGADNDNNENSSNLPSSVLSRRKGDLVIHDDVFNYSGDDKDLPTPPFPRIRPKSLEDRTNFG